MKHKHHIVPKHMGGTDDPSNIVELTVEEHAEAHKKLYEEHGNEFDRIAWKALEGMVKKEDIISDVLSESGKRGGAKGKGKVPWNKGKKTGTNPAVAKANAERVWTDEQRNRASEQGKKNKGKKRPDLSERNKERWLREGHSRIRDDRGRFS